MKAEWYPCCSVCAYDRDAVAATRAFRGGAPARCCVLLGLSAASGSYPVRLRVQIASQRISWQQQQQHRQQQHRQTLHETADANRSQVTSWQRQQQQQQWVRQTLWRGQRPRVQGGRQRNPTWISSITATSTRRAMFAISIVHAVCIAPGTSFFS